MQRPSRTPPREDGVMLLEALIAILIFSLGVLAVVGMQAVTIKNVTDAKYRTEAGFLANKLLSQMWTDAGNIASYDYPGNGTVPTRLTGWVTEVNKLPNATTVQPIVAVTGAGPTGATVTIQVRWQLPEEKSKGLPPHNYTVVASVYTS